MSKTSASQGAGIFLARICVPALAGSMLAGCAFSPPRAWERDLLARPEMVMNASSLEQRVARQVFQSKENASGGEGVSGGGCGCN